MRLQFENSRELACIFGHDVPILIRSQIDDLHRPVFGRPRHEARSQPTVPRRSKIGIVGSHKADLIRSHRKDVGGAQIRFRHRLIGPHNLSAEDRISGKPRAFCYVEHQDDNAV